MMHTSEKLQPQELEKLASVDSPTIANVIELFGCRSDVAGYTDGTVKAVYPDIKPIVGYAVTATFRSAYPAAAKDAYSSLPKVIAAGQAIACPRVIVIQDLDSMPAAAIYGEVMATTFKKFGYVGLVTNGAGRDYEQVRQLGFACFTSSMIASHGYPTLPEANVPVTIAGLHVVPGQLLHADANGIVHIPNAIAGAVAELVDPFIAAEQGLIDYVQSSEADSEGFDAAYGAMKRRVGELAQRAQSMIN